MLFHFVGKLHPCIFLPALKESEFLSVFIIYQIIDNITVIESFVFNQARAAGSLRLIPSHCNISGNEQADRLAKGDMSCPNLTLLYFCITSKELFPVNFNLLESPSMVIQLQEKDVISCLPKVVESLFPRLDLLDLSSSFADWT
ncbi:hypothetical protein TNCV_5047321 [Trichonephila clavipes]|nr:hypothetical protein TNCV_5047321 [Trichonephila clavipes]